MQWISCEVKSKPVIYYRFTVWGWHVFFMQLNEHFCPKIEIIFISVSESLHTKYGSYQVTLKRKLSPFSFFTWYFFAHWHHCTNEVWFQVTSPCPWTIYSAESWEKTLFQWVQITFFLSSQKVSIAFILL